MSAVLHEEATPPILTIERHIATIRLNRPQKLNRIEPQDLRVLKEHLQMIEADSELRVVILIGTGRVFSAGYHLGDLSARKPDKTPSSSDENSFELVANALESCHLPTICALNGSVYGGATDLALACDFRIGVHGTELLMPAGRLGVHYYQGGMKRYVSRLGLNAAKKLFMTAQSIETEEMLAIGYLTEVVSAEQHADTVARLADTLAKNAPLAVQHMKRSLNEIARYSLDIAAFEAGYRACMMSNDLAEGLRSWKERREPKFQGN